MAVRGGARLWGLPLVALLLCLVFGLMDPRFASLSNAQNILRQSSILLVVALAQTFVILSGGLDLSIGSVIGVANVLGAMVAVAHGFLPGVLTMLAVGAACGAVNGGLVALFRVSPLIVTLGMLSLARGAALIITDGMTVGGLPRTFVALGWETLGPIPVIAILAAAGFLFGWVLLGRTVAGRYWYHIGGNEEAARLSGVPVRHYKLLAFLMSGALAGLAAVLHTARSASGHPLAGVGLELSSIAASVLGGISLRGGEGRPVGVLFGVLIFAILGNGLTLLGFSSYLQLMIMGAIFIAAVWLDLRSQPPA